MDIVYKILILLHLVGMAMLVGGWLATIRAPRVLPGMWHGALTQLVTGLLLVGLAESGAVDRDIDNAKIGVKLVVALVITVLVFLNRRRSRSTDGAVAPGAAHTVGGLALLNTAIAALWS